MMRPSPARIAACVLLFAGRLALAVQHVYVAPSGSEAGSGEMADPVATINAGVELVGADANATLRLAPGSYLRGVAVRRGTGKLILKGMHHATDTQREAHTTLRASVSVDRRSIALEGMIIESAEATEEPLVRVTNAPEVTLSNCVLRTSGPALRIAGCSKVTLEECTFLGHRDVVSIEGADEATVRNCTMVSLPFLEAHYTYTARWEKITGFCGIAVTGCGSLALSGCTVQAPQRMGHALWLRRVGTLRADDNRYWGTLTTGTDRELVARTIEDWRQLSGQDAASRLIRLEHVPDPILGCRLDPRSVWGGKPNVTIQVPKNSLVSIGGLDLQNRPVRTLLTEYETREAAELKLFWDRSDSLRNPLPPAKYSANVLRLGLEPSQSWIGNSGGSDDYVQFAVEDLCLLPPGGPLATNSPWDEAGKEAGAYSLDGRVLHRFPDLHGSGRRGGRAVAANGRYVFLACQQGHVEGQDEGYPRKGVTWFGVRRYHHDGSFAPWPNGKGWNRTLLVLDTQPCTAGLAAQGHELYVSDSDSQSIRIFNSDTMEEVKRFPFERPGRLAAEAAGALWIVRAAAPDQPACVVRCDRAGTPRATLSTLSDPAALAVDDARGRLLVADNGPHQVFVYDIAGTAPKLADTLGVPGGIYADPPGTTGDLRFNRITGLAADADGNVYVATSGLETSGAGAELRKFSPQKKRLWRLQGLTHGDGAAPDPASPEDVFTPRQRFRLDYTPQLPTWDLAAWTLDPRKYDDPRAHADYASVLVRRIGGKRILYLADKGVTRLAIFRFDGEIAVPAGLLMPQSRPREWPPGQPETGSWIWRDLNGDGKVQRDEMAAQPDSEPRSWNWFVDAKGGLWRGYEREGILHLPCRGLDEHGNPIYRWDDAERLGTPPPFTEISELEYDPDTDTLFLTGETRQFQRDRSERWGPAGCVMARYDHKTDLRWAIPLDTATTTRAFCYEAPLIFVTDFLQAAIEVFDAESGLKIGTVGPGRPVGYQSGWADFPRCIRACRLPTSEFIVFNEENWRAKIMLYRIRGSPQE